MIPGRTKVLGCVLAAVWLAPAPAAAGESAGPAAAVTSAAPDSLLPPPAAALLARRDLPNLALPDTVRIEARRSWRPRPQVSLLYESLRPSLGQPGLLKVPHPAGFPSRLPAPELSRLGRIACSADKGAYAGLSLGVLGNWAGLWEEREAWHLMGVGAALGAILGATTGSENSRVRIGASVSPAP